MRRWAAVRVGVALTSAFILTSSVAFAGAEELYARGVRSFQSGNYTRAAQDLEASMNAKPTAKAALYLANAHLKLGELQPAKEAFAKVLELEPNHPKRAAIEALMQSIDARVETKVRVESTPPGATIYVDSEASGARGKTPADIDVQVGRRRIIVALDGYESVTREEVLQGGRPASVNVTLHGKGCEVALSAKGPAESRASIDGGEPIALPAKTLIHYGNHKVVFTGAAHEPTELPYDCDGFKPGTLEAALTPRSGRLAIPTGAGTVVKIDGKVVALSEADARSGIGLAPGRHEVAVTVGDEPTRTSIVDVGAGESVQLGLPAEKNGGSGFPSRALYFELVGGGNVALRDWNLGSNAFRAQNGTTRVSPGSSGMAGVRVGFQATPRVAIETEIQWIGLPNALDTSQGITYGANLLYHLLPGRWVPVLEGGAGVYQVVSGKLGADLSGRGHLGLGFRGRATRWLSLRADARDVVSRGFEAGGANNVELLAGAELILR
jgi:hypothetical protein